MIADRVSRKADTPRKRKCASIEDVKAVHRQLFWMELMIAAVLAVIFTLAIFR